VIGVILVVDDEPLITSALRRALIAQQHEVFVVNDPREAMALLEREPIDLMITDKDMPQMSGHELLDQVRETHPDVPCIMLTGAPTVASTLIAVNGDQVIRYLTKPWTGAEPERTVAAGLARRAALLAAATHDHDQRERASVVAALRARDPSLARVKPGPLALVPSAVSDALEATIAMLEDDPATAADIDEVVRRATPIDLAEALAMLPMRRAAVGLLVVPDGALARIEADVRGRNHVLATVPIATGDSIAARLALHAGIDPATANERLGRLSVSTPTGIGQIVIAYRRHAAGAALELRRLVLGTDAPPPVQRLEQIDKYRIVEQVGEGGMGTVYSAVHRTIGREVAIKVLRGAYAADPITMARFVREARAAVRARHPRIVETYDFGHLADGRPYLVMELVRSETLRTRIKRGPLVPIDAIVIARGIAEGLVAAHLVDVIHRDLKPGNVFVDELLDTKLADFGAAKILDDLGDAVTGAGMTLGTPYYMSPEHISGSAIDGRSDLYALGCVLFEMIDGRPPFRGDSARAVLAQHLHAELPPLVSMHAPVSPSLLQVVRTAMAKDPRRRYQTAMQLIGDLDIAATRQAAGR